jgi:hypothetical protein
MTTRETVLYDQLKEAFIIIHKSQQINREMASWEKRIMIMNDDEIEQTCRNITNRISSFINNEKIARREVSAQQIKTKIREELNNL